jgi:hypothetical protein
VIFGSWAGAIDQAERSNQRSARNVNAEIFACFAYFMLGAPAPVYPDLPEKPGEFLRPPGRIGSKFFLLSRFHRLFFPNFWSH